MYRWYHNSTICCIYLADVPEPINRYQEAASESEFIEAVKKSRWLTRGWTLQELLAARHRSFYTMNWQRLALPGKVIYTIADETGIPVKAIEDFKPGQWSVAQKMSWAARRRTTRIEDRAYSLLGIFNINMPLIYGEGGTAFRRLQEEILKNSTDQTIFCWTASAASFSTWRGLLARSPAEFVNSGKFLENKRLKTQPFQLTNKGIQISLNLAPATSASGDLIAFLQCCTANISSQCGIHIRRTHDDNYVRVEPNIVAEMSLPYASTNATLETFFAKPDLAGITWQELERCPRIAGFYFPDIANAVSDPCVEGHVSSIWISEIGPRHQCSWDRKLFSFYVDWDQRAPSSTIARCHFSSLSHCSIEIWVKYDWRNKYGEDISGDDGNERKSGDTDTDWARSECCEWKVQGRSCDQFKMSVSSWIELDDISNAYIHIKFFTSTDHDVCGGADWRV